MRESKVANNRTIDMQINFAIPPNSALQGLLEEFFFIYQRYKIFNTLAINSLGKDQHFPTVPTIFLSDMHPVKRKHPSSSSFPIIVTDAGIVILWDEVQS